MADDKIITELPLIRRYARHNESQDVRFRTFLKSSNVSNGILDGYVKEETDFVWSRIDCTKCANCCKTMAVALDKKDVKRLAQRLHLSEKEFAVKYVVPGEFDELLLKTQPCVFLGSDNKCGVYEDRPQSCRDFPYLHSKNFRSRSLTMLSNVGYCPIVFNVWQRLKTRLWPSFRPRGQRH